MIDAKDLKIGNWIFDAECEPHYFQVEEIRKYVGTQLWAFYRKGSIKAKEVMPIELTPELLIKCGFKKTADGYRLDLEDCYLIGDDEEVWQAREFADIEYTFTVGKKYLHQLQNLYYEICGKELEISL